MQPAGSEAALLVAIAANLAERAGLLTDANLRGWLGDIADELHSFSTQLGADPFGIGEGEEEVRHA